MRMLRIVRLPWMAALVMGAALVIPPASATTIVVFWGSHSSAAEAASGEAEVNWNDADPADDTACTESYAALELQHYLRLMTGDARGFEIIRPEDVSRSKETSFIFLGAAAFRKAGARDIWAASGVSPDSLGSEGYMIKTLAVRNGRAICIVGASRIGTLYGVYAFLDRLGVRWFAPGAANEEIPALSADGFPDFDVRESPGFFTRGFHAWENRADRDFLVWMARNRLNYWCVEQEDKPFLHKLGIMLAGGAHIITEYYLGPNLEYPYDHPRFEGDETKPPDPYPVSAEFQGDADGDKKIRYFEAHPEWYGLQNGRRSDRIESDFGDNFCTSNPDAMKEFLKNAVQDLIDGRFKDANVINAWTLDVGNWCECESCRALGTTADRNLHFAHSYAQAVKKARLEKRINRPIRVLFLIYAEAIEPPTRPVPADFDYDMCIGTVFPIVRCYVHNFDDPLCDPNMDYLKNSRGWAVDPGRFYKGQICIGEYYNVSGYKCLPVCFMHTMAHDIPYYFNALNARHFHYMHVTTAKWGNKSLTNWQMARQLWDPAVDCEKLWEDYFGRRYGPAASQMRSFYESLEKMLSNASPIKYQLARRLGAGEFELFPDSHFQYESRSYPRNDGPDMADILKSSKDCRNTIEAVKTMRLPERVARRIAEDDQAFTYGERTMLYLDALCRAQFLFRKGEWDAAEGPLREAEALARLLKADTVSTGFSSSHANAPDALEATYAPRAVEDLRDRIAAVKSRGPYYPDRSGLLTYKDAGGMEHRIESPRDWGRRRLQILDAFQKVAGPLPGAARDILPDVQIQAEDLLGTVIRRKITFAVEEGDRVPAYLFVPAGLKNKVPAMLCLHQTIGIGKSEPAGLGKNPDLDYALELAEKGYVTLAPDYPGFGEYKINPYDRGYASATMKGIRNHMRAVDVLQAMPEVDGDRIGVIGHSLGGHNAVFLALFDPRLKVIVSSCGFTSFSKYQGGDLTGWSHGGYMPRIASLYARDPARMPFDFTELAAAMAPRAFFVNAPLKDDNFDSSGVDDCLRAAKPVYGLFGKGEKLAVVHPDCGHGFPPEARRAAYDFIATEFRR